MKLIVGLGNSGEEYKNNRHNAGYIVIDKLSKTSKLKNSKQIKIFKSQNFMNESGDFVKKLVDQYQMNLADLWVIHDDLDLALGAYKIQFGKGPKEHKGLLSIYEKLGSRDFWHVRVGIEKRNRENRVNGEEYVLQDFTVEERKIIDKVIIEICKKLVKF